jgi:hypothetical protein
MSQEMCFFEFFLECLMMEEIIFHSDYTCPTTIGTYFSDFCSPEHWMPE